MLNPPDQLANTIGERQRGPREAGDYVASVEVEEVVSALAVPGRSERQRLERPGICRVVPVLVCVNLLSRLEEEMFSELDRLASNDGLRA